MIFEALALYKNLRCAHVEPIRASVPSLPSPLSLLQLHHGKII